jgi:ketosteroid isomerase-like protein
MKLTRSLSGMLVVLPLAFAACGGKEPEVEAAPAPEPMSQAGADAMRNAFVTSYMSKDAAGASGFFAENAVMYAADGTVVNGRPAIQEHLAKMQTAGYDSLGLVSSSFTTTPEGAVDQGTWIFRQLDPQTKEATRTTGGYMTTIVRQADGTFQIAKDSTWQTGELPAEISK